MNDPSTMNLVFVVAAIGIGWFLCHTFGGGGKGGPPGTANKMTVHQIVKAAEAKRDEAIAAKVQALVNEIGDKLAASIK